MTRIFISYRHKLSDGTVGRIYDRLAADFGKENVFMDVMGLRPGVDFAQKIEDTLKQCNVLLAIISPRWAEVRLADGDRRRLDDPDDILRAEIATAIRREILVVPVLTDGAEMPTADQLPTDIRALATRQFVDLDHNHFHKRMNDLIEVIQEELTISKSSEAEQVRALDKVAGAAANCEIIDHQHFITDENVYRVLQSFPNVQRISIKQSISEGQSGSLVFAVDAVVRGADKTRKSCFLKLHHSQSDTPHQRHREAYSTAIRRLMPEVLDVTPWNSSSKKIALLYYTPIAKRFTSLERLIESRVGRAVNTVTKVTQSLMDWNTPLHFDNMPPHKLMQQALSHSQDPAVRERRLNDPGASVGARLRDSFALTTDRPLIRFEGEGFHDRASLPNPLAYLYDEHLWGGIRNSSVTWPKGHLHGDLNVRNVLTYSEQPSSDDFDVALIDFDTYDRQNLTLLDFAQLELNILLTLYNPVYAENRKELVKLSEYLSNTMTAQTLPDLSAKAVGTVALIRPIRATVHRMFETVDVDWLPAFWISRVAVGLELSRKTKTHDTKRIIALLFAADSMHRLIEYLDVPELRRSSLPHAIAWPD